MTDVLKRGRFGHRERYTQRKRRHKEKTAIYKTKNPRGYQKLRAILPLVAP